MSVKRDRIKGTEGSRRISSIRRKDKDRPAFQRICKRHKNFRARLARNIEISERTLYYSMAFTGIILKKESGIILRLPYFLIISGFY